MKCLFLVLILLHSWSIESTLKFNVQYGKPKCYLEELFDTSCAIIK